MLDFENVDRNETNKLNKAHQNYIAFPFGPEEGNIVGHKPVNDLDAPREHDDAHVASHHPWVQLQKDLEVILGGQNYHPPEALVKVLNHQ